MLYLKWYLSTRRTKHTHTKHSTPPLLLGKILKTQPPAPSLYQGRVPTIRLPSIFSLVTSPKVRINPAYFLAFSFTTFATQLSNFKATPRISPKLQNLKQVHPSKNVSLSNLCKMEVMMTSLIEMLDLPNFGHMTTSTI